MNRHDRRAQLAAQRRGKMTPFNPLTPVTAMPSNTDIERLEEEALIDGVLQIKDASFYRQFEQEQLSLFSHNYGFYTLPTTELIDWLKKEIGDNNAIEIGAGNGAVGRALGIPITDSCLQNMPEIKEYCVQGYLLCFFSYNHVKTLSRIFYLILFDKPKR